MDEREVDERVTGDRSAEEEGELVARDRVKLTEFERFQGESPARLVARARTIYSSYW